MAYSAQAKRYDWMSALFDRAAKQVDKLFARSTNQGIGLPGSSGNNGNRAENKYSPMQRLCLDLGTEALEENGDWVLLHRERPLEVPHAG